MFWSNLPKNRGRQRMLEPAAAAALFEALEERRLMAATATDVFNPVSATPYGPGYSFSVSVDSGTLSIIGSAFADTVTVSPSPLQPIGGTTMNVDVTISNTFSSSTISKTGVTSVFFDGKGGSDKITNLSTTLRLLARGGSGNDTLNGGGASDTLIGGYGDDVLNGYGGDDTLVDIGGGQADQLSGGTGTDYFWADSESTEVVGSSSTEDSGGYVHRVSSFMNYNYIFVHGGATYSISRDPDGADLMDPDLKPSSSLQDYQSFSSNPLFSSSGPAAEDIEQGGLGDCWLLASLSAVAKASPETIRQTVADMGDGSYAVHFDDGGTDVYVRVDGELPVNWKGNLIYADLGAENSIWVGIVEKAWAVYRHADADYQEIEGGSGAEAFGAMGLDTLSVEVPSFATAHDLLFSISYQLAAGDAVVIGTINSGATTLVNKHDYRVSSVNLAGNTITLYNPWGSYVTISGEEFLADCEDIWTGIFA